MRPPAIEPAPDLALRNDENEIDHLVCCRSDWSVALCGFASDHLNLTATTICTMCIEEAARRLPDFDRYDPPRCPVDHQPCPDEHTLDLMILRRVT